MGETRLHTAVGTRDETDGDFKQQLLEFESPFKWQPEARATCDIDDAGIGAFKYLKLEGGCEFAYRILLSYAYIRCDKPKFKKAAKHQQEARKLCEDADNSGLTSGLVLEANELGIRLRRQEFEDLDRRFTELRQRWQNASDDEKVEVATVKGLILLRFGLEFYEEALDSFVEANRLRRRSFPSLFGEARTLARLRRIAGCVSGMKEQEKRAWSVALECANGFYAKSVDKSGLHVFFALLAEAELNDDQIQSERLADRVFTFVTRNNAGIDHEVEAFLLDKCCKVNRVLSRISKSIDRREELACEMKKCQQKMLDKCQKCEDAQHVFNCAVALRYLGRIDEALKMLRKARMFARKPGHPYVDLESVRVKLEAGKLPDVTQAKDAFAQLVEKYKKQPHNQAFFLAHEACYLVEQGHHKTGFQLLKGAVALDLQVQRRLSWRKERSPMIKKLRDANMQPEEIAWCLHRFGAAGNENEIQQKYQECLQRDSENEFALENFAEFCLEHGRDAAARRLLERLPNKNQRKRRHLPRLILNDAGQPKDFESLELCLRLGGHTVCLDVLKLLKARKAACDTRSEVLHSVKSGIQSVDSHALLFFSSKLYALCARMLLEVEEATDSLKENVRNEVNDLLQLRSATVTEAAADRDSLMRINRLKATMCSLASDSSNSNEFSNCVVTTLKEAKELLDRSFADFFSSSRHRFFSYVHAFDQLKVELKKQPDFNREQKAAPSEADRKAKEMESLISLLMTREEDTSLEDVRRWLKDGFKKVDPQVDTRKETRDAFDFMAAREHRILTDEKCWLVRWIYSVNNEKHSREIQVKDLTEELQRDSSGRETSRTAFDLANLAAEFAEETWLVLGRGQSR